MLSQKYAEASAEVLDVLDHMSSNDVAKVSEKFIAFLKENASKNYVPNLDYSKQLKDMNLKEEARGILALMYEKYWCSEDKKKELFQSYSENEQIYQKELDALRESHSLDNLFQKEVKKEEQHEDNSTEIMLVVTKKENIFIKLIKKIFKK